MTTTADNSATQADTLKPAYEWTTRQAAGMSGVLA
jgi:hypothetical protein